MFVMLKDKAGDVCAVNPRDVVAMVWELEEPGLTSVVFRESAGGAVYTIKVKESPEALVAVFNREVRTYGA